MTPTELRAAMKSLRFTQSEVAARMGVGVIEVRRWLAGDTPVPKTVAILMHGWSTDPVQRAAILAKGNEQPQEPAP